MIMSEGFLPIKGTPCDPESLNLRKARDLAEMLSHGVIEYATFSGCLRREEEEIVIFEVDVELGQLRVNAIHPTERVAVVFATTDDRHPLVFALRADFPNVPHLALQMQEFPRSLCLYDEPYAELKRRWTSPRFVERIRIWFSKTAKGTLHADDQPLEPLLWGGIGQIVLPPDVLSPICDLTKPLHVVATDVNQDGLFLVAHREGVHRLRSNMRWYPILMQCEPQPHGVIRFAPSNLDQLARLTGNAGLDLLNNLRSELASAKPEANDQSEYEQEFLSSRLILILVLPKTRQPGEPPETCDVRAFVTRATVREVGIDIGLWSEANGVVGQLLAPPDGCSVEKVWIDLLNPVPQLRRKWARELNGLSQDANDPTITCVGAGALGSQIIMNMARAGVARWTVVDDDYLLPHNLARHVLTGGHVGFRKAQCVSDMASTLTEEGKDAFSAIPANVLCPGEDAKRLVNAMADSDLILDSSASVEVGRHLCRDVESPARRVSVFLNPAGSDLVMLAEDSSRKYPLDTLEMQYYRALVQDGELVGHFSPVEGRRRYGQSCRDVSTRIPQDAMALHAAISSRAVQSVLASDEPQIKVWRTSEDLCVDKVSISPARPICHHQGDWRVLLDDFLVERLQELRQSRLPNETGGVLLGSFDLERRIAYLVDTIPSPPDSKEWPQLYIRGCRGLTPREANVEEKTDGAIHYIGEWHSHPTGCPTVPSQNDSQVFAWLMERMNAEGLPALMMIVGDPGCVSCFLGKMPQQEELLPG